MHHPMIHMPGQDTLLQAPPSITNASTLHIPAQDSAAQSQRVLSQLDSAKSSAQQTVRVDNYNFSANYR